MTLMPNSGNAYKLLKPPNEHRAGLQHLSAVSERESPILIRGLFPLQWDVGRWFGTNPSAHGQLWAILESYKFRHFV